MSVWLDLAKVAKHRAYNLPAVTTLNSTQEEVKDAGVKHF